MTRIMTIAGIVWLERLRRKDIYVLLVLCAALLMSLMSLNVLGLGGMVRYIYDIGLLLAWIFSLIITITTSAQQIPQEQSKGTIFPLLAKPVTRADIIIGKWLGAWTISSFATSVFYALTVLVAALRGGSLPAVTLAQGLTAHCAALAIISAIAITLSTRSNSDAAASITAVFTAAALLLLPRVPNLILHETSEIRQTLMMIIYYLLPHFEIFDMRRRIVHDWGPVPWTIWLITIMYAIIFTAIFLLIAWLGFRKKRFPQDMN